MATYFSKPCVQSQETHAEGEWTTHRLFLLLYPFSASYCFTLVPQEDGLYRWYHPDSFSLCLLVGLILWELKSEVEGREGWYLFPPSHLPMVLVMAMFLYSPEHLLGSPSSVATGLTGSQYHFLYSSERMACLCG